jgi:riboflavin synthase
MFTGIIECFSEVKEVKNNLLVIEKPKKFIDLKLGQSIACNGACLSIKNYTNNEITFDVLSETFRKTNLGQSKFINIERAMISNSRFEGHIVLGHVDETIKLLDIKEDVSGKEYIFSLPLNKKYIVEKGSISINGISLTICNITEFSFSVFIIPITLEKTNFQYLKLNDLVNIEYDYIGKLILNNK